MGRKAKNFWSEYSVDDPDERIYSAPDEAYHMTLYADGSVRVEDNTEDREYEDFDFDSVEQAFSYFDEFERTGLPTDVLAKLETAA